MQGGAIDDADDTAQALDAIDAIGDRDEAAFASGLAIMRMYGCNGCVGLRAWCLL